MATEDIERHFRYGLSFHKRCLPTFFEFLTFLESCEVPYSLDCGTLLGCIRDSGPVSYDDDYDIFVPRHRLSGFLATFTDAGTGVVRINGAEYTIKPYRTFYHVLKGDERVADIFTTNDEHHRNVDCSVYDDRILKPFAGRECYVARQHQTLLLQRYGPSHMTMYNVCNHTIAGTWRLRESERYATLTPEEYRRLTEKCRVE